MTILSKQHHQIIDQRNEIIPAVWVKTKAEHTPIQQHFQQVWTSQKEGQLTQHIVHLIEQAQQTVIICSFLLANDKIENAIFDAAERGVRIYLMLACETRLEQTADDDFSKRCEAQHKAMLKRLAGKVLIRSAPHYHAKAVLVDAIGNDGSTTPQGLLLTANLTTEALERNEELAVMLKQDEIVELATFFRWGFFAYAQHQMNDNVHFADASKENIEHPKNLQYLLCTSPQQQSILDKALHFIQKAKHSIVLSSFGFDENHQITTALYQKAKQGVAVTILARIRPNNMAALLHLQKAGATIYGFKWLHAKAILIDDLEGMVMSANLQVHGLDKGFEIGVMLQNERAEELSKHLQRFLSQASHQLHTDIALKDVSGEIKIWEKAQFKELEIQPFSQQDLSDITADCASDLDKKAKIPPANWQAHPFHQIKYQWKVLAPVLPKNAQEQFREEKRLLPEEHVDQKKQSDNKKKSAEPKFEIIKHAYQPKVFCANQQYFIAINNIDEIQAAIDLRSQEKELKQAKIVSKGNN